MAFAPIVVILALVSLVDAIRRPTMRRLALRNVSRRRSEAALVMLGSLLGTAIITAAFIVGDTLGASFRDQARTQLGPTDEVVRSVGLDKNAAVIAALTANPVPGTDGVLEMVRAGVSVATTGPDRRAEPFAGITEVDFDAARAFGGDQGATGMADAGPTPTGNELVMTKNLARELGLDEPGATVTVFGFANRVDMKVRQIVPNVGIAGFGGQGFFRDRSVLVPEGTIAKLIAGGSGAAAQPPASLVLVSNDGGVYSGAKTSETVAKALTERVAGLPGVEVVEAKQNLLDEGDAISAQFTQLFSGIGSFSVIAGILLLVNIFVMLADERKSELGMLRAVGLKRNQLVRTFGMEGAVYSIVSAFLGVIAGIGVGRLVAVLAAAVFNRGGGGGINLRFALESQSLTTGFFVGATISMLTVWGTSIRLGRLNVIRAIRDIAEAPASRRRRMRSYIFASLGVLLGLSLLQGALKNDDWFGALAGVPIASTSAIVLLQAFMPRRLAVGIGCGIALVWDIVAFTLFPDAFTGTSFGAFVVQGVILVGSATAIAATNDDIAIWMVSKLGVSKRTLAARLGFAYPLARVFRTSMLLGMYAIVVFTLTFISVFSSLFAAQAPQFAKDTSAGYDILVDSNYSNPVPASELTKHPQVVAETTLDQAFPKWTTETTTKPESWQITGFDESLLARGVPKLNDRLERFGKDDRKVWEAVMTDPTLVILSDFFLQRGGPPESRLEVGDEIKAYDNVSGRVATLTIAGKVDSDFIFSGPMVGKQFLGSFATSVTPSRHYVAVKPGADPEVVADQLTGELIGYGVDAATFSEFIGEALQQQQGFMALMRGYLGLGLVIGIAGLGVVMVRAVRERRRQIGMLRAMGFQSRLVRQAFLIEAAFLAVQGVVMGTVLALVTSYNMLTNSDFFGESSITFEIPTMSIIVVSAVALVASLAAASFPAGQASKIKPAVALRIAD